MNTKQIPVFFACDDNYIPFLGVAISSLKEKANRAYQYRIIILNEGLKKENKERISAFADAHFIIEYFDISKTINKLRDALSLRLRVEFSSLNFLALIIWPFT